MFVDGILVINKEKNMTSHDVVGQVRRLLGTKKVGHAGTLDPLATGVLVLGVGRGTKLLQFLTAETKVYQAVLKLGISTDTYDSEGHILETKPYVGDISASDISAVFESFLGDSMQLPPVYSAIKKNGRPLYDYARNNEAVEIEARPIHIEKLQLLDFSDDKITFEVVCSKGTYIRSLCVDIAARLGYPGMMAELERKRSGSFTLDEAVSLDGVAKGDYTMIAIDDALKGMDRLVIDQPEIVFHGKKIVSDIDHQTAVYDKAGHLLAVYGPDGHGCLKSIRGLWS